MLAGGHRARAQFFHVELQEGVVDEVPPEVERGMSNYDRPGLRELEQRVGEGRVPAFFVVMWWCFPDAMLPQVF